MSKRIKRVFNRADQVIQLWANQSQDRAKSRNVFFSGTRVYSYGAHYLLGEMHTINGVQIAFINSRRYSATTAKHQRLAWWTNRGTPRLWSDNPGDPLSLIPSLIKMQDRLIAELFDFFSLKKFYEGYTVDSGYYLLEDVLEFNTLCERLELKHLALDISTEFIDLMNEHIALRNKRNAELTKEVPNATV